MGKIKYTEKDLDLLILEHLDTKEECAVYPQLCAMLSTEAGKQRIFTRIKEVILNDGNTSIDSAIEVVESELSFTVESDQ